MTMMRSNMNGALSRAATPRGKKQPVRGALDMAAGARRVFGAGGTTDVDIDSNDHAISTIDRSVDTETAENAAREGSLDFNPGSWGPATDDRGFMERAGDWINSKFDAQHFGGTLGGALLGGVVGMAAGPVINAIGDLNDQQIQNAIEKGNFNEKGELIGTGLFGETVAINAGPGPTGGGFRDDGSQSQGDRSGDNVDMTGPPGVGGGGGPQPTQPRQSTVWDPATQTYKPVLIHPDGRRTNADGTPLWRDGGRVSGLIDGDTGGRADEVDADLPPGSYIIPATEVSARGDGNTRAGALEMARDLGVSPRKIDTVRGGPVKARVAHGELFVAPQDVKRLGGPGALDQYVMQLRRQHINKLSKLPRPQ